MLVTLEIVAVVLVPLDSVVDPREVAVVSTLKLQLIKEGWLISSTGNFVSRCCAKCHI